MPFAWSIFVPDPRPADAAELLRSLHDAGLPSEADDLGEGAFVLGPEGEEPRIELSFRVVDRIDLRDRYAEARNPPPAELAPMVESAQLEWQVVRPTGFSLDENERCLALVKLLATAEGAVVWAPEDRRWWSGPMFSPR